MTGYIIFSYEDSGEAQASMNGEKYRKPTDDLCCYQLNGFLDITVSVNKPSLCMNHHSVPTMQTCREWFEDREYCFGFYDVLIAL